MRDFFLETERVLFSRWTKGDINLANSLWGEKDVAKYIAKTGQFTDKEIADRLDVEINNDKRYGVQYWPIFEKGTNSFIGCCGLRPRNIEKNTYELGFHLRPEHWGKGIGTEAAHAVKKIAFNNIICDELFAGHHPENIGSKNILKKLGFQYDEDIYYEPTGLYHPFYKCTK